MAHLVKEDLEPYTCKACGDVWPVRILATDCTHKRMERLNSLAQARWSKQSK